MFDEIDFPAGPSAPSERLKKIADILGCSVAALASERVGIPDLDDMVELFDLWEAIKRPEDRQRLLSLRTWRPRGSGRRLGPWLGMPYMKRPAYPKAAGRSAGWLPGSQEGLSGQKERSTVRPCPQSAPPLPMP